MAGAATWTSRRSAVRSRRTAQASRRTVLIALAANLLVGVAKLIGGLASGSAAMLAEAALGRRHGQPGLSPRVDSPSRSGADTRSALWFRADAVPVDVH